MALHLILYCIWLYSCSNTGLAQSQEENVTFPIQLPPSFQDGTNSSKSTCFSQTQVDALHKQARELIQNRYINPCGGVGWTRAVYLDMSDPSQQCPLNWTLVNSPVRGCGRTSTGRHTCDSALYAVYSRTYSSVCGRILAYQRGISTAFYNSFRRRLNSTELAYVSGVSLTHGRPGSRNHIWTFAGAWYEQDSHYHTQGVCPCTNINIPWPHQVPSFIGNDYFCETGNRDGNSNTIFYIDDPLWNGKGCGQNSTCCEFNHPPWFHKSLPQPTNDDLELRLCTGDGIDRENKVITLIDIYIK